MASSEGREALYLLRELKQRQSLSSIVDVPVEGSDSVLYDFGDGRQYSEHLEVPFHNAAGQCFALRALVLFYRFEGQTLQAYMKAMLGTKGSGGAKRFVGIKDKQELEKFMKGLSTTRVPEDAEAVRERRSSRRVQRFPATSTATVLSRPGHDFSLALEVMNAMKREEGGAQRDSGGKSGDKRARPSDERSRTPSKKQRMDNVVRRKPIIMAPASRSALLQLINVASLLKNGEYRSAREMEKGGVSRPGEVRLTHMIDGARIEFLVLDAPHRVRERQWQDVVAVVVDGPAWQFKQYPSKPVDMFERACGVHFRFRDEEEPETVKGWKVHRMTLARSQRHGDRVVAAQFWRCVEQHIRLKRPEFLPRKQK